jgi:hypothetical protein
MADIPRRDNVPSGRAVAGAAAPIQVLDPRGRPVREDDRPRMGGKHCREPFLVLPSEPTRRVLRELDVVRRVSVDEVVRLEVHLLEITGRETQPARASRYCEKSRRQLMRAYRPNGTLKAQRRLYRHSPLKRAVEVIEQRGGLAAPYRTHVDDAVVLAALELPQALENLQTDVALAISHRSPP